MAVDRSQCVLIENDQQGAAVNAISAYKGKFEVNSLDSFCQFNMEEFITAVSLLCRRTDLTSLL